MKIAEPEESEALDDLKYAARATSAPNVGTELKESDL